MGDDRVPPADLASRYGGVVWHRPTVKADAEKVAAVAADAMWGVGTLVEHEGHILLVREGDTWLLPGGIREVGETHAEGAVRETREETGLAVRIVDLAAITVRTFVHGESSATFPFATFLAELTGERREPSPNPGYPGEGVDEAAWHCTVPEVTLDRDLVVRLRESG